MQTSQDSNTELDDTPTTTCVGLNRLIDSHIDAINTLTSFEEENAEVLERLKELRAQKKETRAEVMDYMIENSIEDHTYRGQQFTTKVKERVKYTQKLVESEFEESAVSSYKRKYGEQKASMKVKRTKSESE